VALAELAIRAGELEAAVGEASRAVRTAAAARLPTEWRARAAFAQALRAADREDRAAEEVGPAAAQVAALARTIDDAEVRTAFEAGAAESLSAGRSPS
jgi:hypothetical protein